MVDSFLYGVLVSFTLDIPFLGLLLAIRFLRVFTRPPQDGA